MIQKAKIRNEWVDAYLADGSLDEVPEALVDEVKAKAAMRTPVAPPAPPVFENDDEE
jgi:hypothetical protein